MIDQTNEQTRQSKPVIVGSNQGRLRRVWSKKITLLVLGLVLFVVGLILIPIMGFYLFGWRDNITESFTRNLSLPVAKVAGDTISSSDYFDRRATLTSLELTPGDALNELVEEIYIANYAERNNISVSDTEIDERASLLSDTNLDINDSSDYKKRVEYQVIATKMQEKIPRDPLLREQALKRAKSIIREVEAGKPLTEFTNNKSPADENPSVSSPPGSKIAPPPSPPKPDNTILAESLPPNLRSQAVKLNEGEVTKQPISSGNGYLIIQGMGKDAKGSRKVKVLHVAPNFDLWLRDSKQNQPAKLYIRSKTETITK